VIRTATLARVADLTDARALSRVLGPVKSVTCSPLGLLGHSGSTHERVGVTLKDGTGVSLIVKGTLLSQDWAAVCTSDRIGKRSCYRHRHWMKFGKSSRIRTSRARLSRTTSAC
jgi:hypothetical protein